MRTFIKFFLEKIKISFVALLENLWPLPFLGQVVSVWVFFCLIVCFFLSKNLVTFFESVIWCLWFAYPTSFILILFAMVNMEPSPARLSWVLSEAVREQSATLTLSAFTCGQAKCRLGRWHHAKAKWWHHVQGTDSEQSVTKLEWPNAKALAFSEASKNTRNANNNRTLQGTKTWTGENAWEMHSEMHSEMNFCLLSFLAVGHQ